MHFFKYKTVNFYVLLTFSQHFISFIVVQNKESDVMLYGPVMVMFYHLKVCKLISA